MDRGTGTVVVGVDESADGDAALRHALEEALARGASLRVVVACAPPPPLAVVPEDPAPDPAAIRCAVADAVARRVDAVARLVPGATDVPVEVLALAGSPARVLVEAARDAELLVIGHRGRGPWRSALLGSVGLGVVLHAPCPVTVVPVVALRAPASSATTASAAPDTEPRYETSPTPLPVGPIA